MTNVIKKPELLAPVGDWKMLHAAIKGGADAIYFGLDKLNMRAKAQNFTLDNLTELTSICRSNNVDTHLTLNSIVYESELVELDEILVSAKKAGVTMIICWDMSVVSKCIQYEMPFCISTQASISNSASAHYYKQLGAKRIVLARECSLDMIKVIKKNTGMEIETFVHGAMCVAVSGRCFMSHHVFGNSANKGECIQPCRREFRIYDESDDYSLLIGTDYVMSPKDLCTIEFIDELIESGIDSFKIEGRKRSPEYILKVVSAYRKAIDFHAEGKLTLEIKKELLKELESVYNRGFSSGFYHDKPSGNDYTIKYGSSATTRKVYVGKVVNYFKKTNIAQVKIESQNLELGASGYIIGDTTGVVDVKFDAMQVDGNEVEIAEKGDDLTFYCEEVLRRNDKLFKIVDVKN